MVIRICVFFIAFLTYGAAHCQSGLYLGGQLGAGILFNNYEQSKRVLKPRFQYGTQSKLSIQYRIANRIGVEIGAGQDFFLLRLKDKNFSQRHEGYNSLLKSKINYYSFFGNIQYFQPISDEISLYFQLGYSINQIGKDSLYKEKVFALTNEKVIFNAIYPEQNNSINAEIGIQKLINDKHFISLGINYNAGQGQLFKANYQVQDNNGLTIPGSQDQVTSQGNYLGLALKYHYRILYKEKRVKPVVVHHKEPKNKKPPVKIPDPVVKKAPADTSKKIGGRTITVSQKLHVKQASLKIEVWDNESVDGDIISLNFNDNWILSNYTLQKLPHLVTVTLRPGKNLLVLHALNLGKYPPNTAAMRVDDGITKQTIILESTLQQSGTVEIILDK
jgi:hypothetical protein